MESQDRALESLVIFWGFAAWLEAVPFSGRSHKSSCCPFQSDFAERVLVVSS